VNVVEMASHFGCVRGLALSSALSEALLGKLSLLVALFLHLVVLFDRTAQVYVLEVNLVPLRLGMHSLNVGLKPQQRAAL